MEIKQIYTGCLAQGSYYIKCCDEAAIVDPLREVQQYIDMAERDGVKIKYIFETHFHADFVSGHLTLAEKTGAQIVFGPTAKTGFESLIAEDGQRFKIGKVELEGIDLCRPCKHLSEILDQDNIIKEFLRRGGLRCQILTSSTIEVGDKINVYR